MVNSSGRVLTGEKWAHLFCLLCPQLSLLPNFSWGYLVSLGKSRQQGTVEWFPCWIWERWWDSRTYFPAQAGQWRLHPPWWPSQAPACPQAHLNHKSCLGQQSTFQSCISRFRRSLHFSIVCEGLWGCCCSVGWLGLAVIMHSWVQGKCISLGETFLHFSYCYRNENAQAVNMWLFSWHRRAEIWCLCGLVPYCRFVGTLSLGAAPSAAAAVAPHTFTVISD